MENETPELESASNGTKDMWLFLIVLDVIVLCVLGFFLYKHFSAKFVQMPAVVQTGVEPRVLDEVVVVAESPAEPLEKEPLPVVEVAAVEKPMLVQPAVARELPVASEPKIQPETPAVEQPVATKESIVVAPGKGKYRPVTFRWFGEGKEVAIVSGFTNRVAKPLKKVGDHWEITLSIEPGTYRFLYKIDGKNTLDPYAAAENGRSVVVVK